MWRFLHWAEPEEAHDPPGCAPPVDEETLIAPEGPGALSLQVQVAVTLLSAELALLWCQIAVEIDLAAAQRLAMLQRSELRGDTGDTVLSYGIDEGVNLGLRLNLAHMHAQSICSCVMRIQTCAYKHITETILSYFLLE